MKVKSVLETVGFHLSQYGSKGWNPSEMQLSTLKEMYPNEKPHQYPKAVNLSEVQERKTELDKWHLPPFSLPTDNVPSFSARTKRLLQRARVQRINKANYTQEIIEFELKHIGDLVLKTEKELLELEGFGRKSLKEVKDFLATLDLRLSPFSFYIFSFSSEKRY